MVKQEWRELFHNTWFKIVMLAIIIIPCVYAGVFLGSMWDPYGNTGHIPVAIVNEDQEVSYNHQSLNVGEQLVKNLEDNDSMSFHFVNNDDAMKGLENGDYYMVITIPSDFSQSATTLLDTNPKKMILNYTTNPGTNYIASKMDDSAIAKIKTEVSASVTKTYAKTIFDQIATLSNGLNDAAVGTDDLDAGVKQLLNGNQTLSQNLKTLASRSLTFEDGTQTLTNGLKDYIDGVVTVHDGVYSLKNGLDQLNQSTDSLSKGINLLNDGSSRLSSGVSQYTDGVSQTYEGTQLLVSKNKELSDGMQSLSSGTATLATLNQQLNAKLQEYSQHIGAGDISGATQDMDTIQKLQKTITIITTNLNSSVNGGSYYVLKDGNVVLGDSGQPITTTITKDKTLTSGITAYTTGVQQVNKGLAQLDSQTPELVKGSQQLSQGVQSLATQAPSLVKGIQALDGGAMNLYTGMDQLVANNSKLLIGSKALNQGAQQIGGGTQQLADGSITLGNGLQAVNDGTATLNTSLKDGAKKSEIVTTDNTFDMMASPVDTNHQEISTVENNGHAMAPYMMSVALYVACLAFALMYPLLKNVDKAKSGIQYWLSKSTVWFFISTVAAIAMIATLMLLNGFHPQQTLMTFIFAIVVAAAFMSLVTLLSITTGRIGEFLLLIFMVINLGGSAGTYPLETSGQIYQVIHSFVPFTYSVNGFRKVISQTTASIQTELLVFIGIIVICSLLTILIYNHRVKKPTPLIPQAFEENQ